MIYLYGVTRSSVTMPVVRGVAGATLETIDEGPIAAVVSRLPEPDHRATKRDLLAHSDALQEVVNHGNDVLPMRFGTTFADEDELRDALLIPNARAFLEMLEAVTGKVEVQVKGTYVEQAIVRRVVSGDRRIRRLKDSARVDDRIELGRRVSEAINRERYRDARLIIDALEKIADATNISDPLGEYGLVNVSFLVRRDRLDEFEAAFDKLPAQVRELAELRCVGPLAPFSFVDAGALSVGRWA